MRGRVGEVGLQAVVGVARSLEEVRRRGVGEGAGGKGAAVVAAGVVVLRGHCKMVCREGGPLPLSRRGVMRRLVRRRYLGGRRPVGGRS